MPKCDIRLFWVFLGFLCLSWLALSVQEAYSQPITQVQQNWINKSKQITQLLEMSLKVLDERSLSEEKLKQQVTTLQKQVNQLLLEAQNSEISSEELIRNRETLQSQWNQYKQKVDEKVAQLEMDRWLYAILSAVSGFLLGFFVQGWF